jgi:hypothetical protein
MTDEPKTPLPECYEGPEAYERFDTTMSALLSVQKKDNSSAAPSSAP